MSDMVIKYLESQEPFNENERVENVVKRAISVVDEVRLLSKQNRTNPTDEMLEFLYRKEIFSEQDIQYLKQAHRLVVAAERAKNRDLNCQKLASLLEEANCSDQATDFGKTTLTLMSVNQVGSVALGVGLAITIVGTFVGGPAAWVGGITMALGGACYHSEGTDEE